MVNSHEPDQAPASGTTRRSVVRAGAMAAWTVPLVQFAAAAPAMAASGPAALSVVLAPVVRVGNSVPIVSTITNDNTLATTAFQVTVDVYPTAPVGVDFDQAGGASATTPSGFNAPTKSAVPGHANGARFTYTATSQLAGTGSAPDNARGFNVTVTITNGAPGTAVVTALPGGAGTSGSAPSEFLV